MDIRQNVLQLSYSQTEELAEIRKARAFCPKKYTNGKVKILGDYLSNNSISGCIVGVSGGIDSAVVVKLLELAQSQGVLKYLYPITMPNLTSPGVSGQSESLQRANLACSNLCHTIKLDESVEIVNKNTIDGILKPGTDISNWAAGQLTPQIRMVTLAHTATILRDKGIKSIIVGTTNRDEGAYLGYVGKYSDGMVDIQLISDLHKSEVRQLAKYLGVHETIQNASPNGDMFDGATDEQVFGASYDAIELHLNRKIPGEIGEHIENVHNYNLHKYRVGSPAVHLDIMESGVSGGWPVQFSTKYWSELKRQGDIIKPQFVSPMNFLDISFPSHKNDITFEKYGECGDIVHYTNVFSTEELRVLLEAFNKSSKKEANIFGYIKENHHGEGSQRASLYNINLAKTIWDRIISSQFRGFTQADRPITDWNEGEMYIPIGVSPLMRFIGYKNNGSLVPHYDYSFKDGPVKTLHSVVIYLTSNTAGATRFLKDDQSNSWNKDLSDWSPEEKQSAIVEYQFLPKAGDVLVFPHHLLHDSDYIDDQEKVIIRTDVFWQGISY